MGSGVGTVWFFFFFLRMRRPPRSTQSRSSAASDVYKRQNMGSCYLREGSARTAIAHYQRAATRSPKMYQAQAVSYTHLRAHETVLDLVCRLLLEKKNTK